MTTLSYKVLILRGEIWCCWLLLLEGNVDKCNRPIAQGHHITAAIAATAVILLQIVMVSLGTHLVKNHESQFKNQRVLNWKYLGLYVTRHLSWKQTPKLFSTVCWNLNKIVLLFKAQKRLKQVCFVERQPQWQPQKSHDGILYKNIFRSIDRFTGCMPWIIFRLWGFLCVRDAGGRAKWQNHCYCYYYH